MAKQLPITLLLLLIVGAAGVVAAAAQPDDAKTIVVITHPGVAVESLSEIKLRAIFGMRNRSWQDGEAIKVFVFQDADPVHITFTKSILKTFPFNLRRIWDRRVYSGTGQSPTVLKSQQQMLDTISTTENAIGYIRRERVSGAVKVVELK